MRLPALVGLLLSVLLSACAVDTHKGAAPPEDASGQLLQPELDRMFMLLAYAVVESEWQNETAYLEGKSRGYNIGSVLVSPAGMPVFWAVNSNDVENNATQHGEVRLVQQFLANKHVRNIEGYTVYTTLEPCAMCSGLMTMTKVRRVVHGQLDPEYGGAHARLSQVVRPAQRPDSAGKEWAEAYPRLFVMDASALRERQQLEEAYGAAKLKSPEIFVGAWLYSADAHTSFAAARSEFCALHPSREAQPAYDVALSLKKGVCIVR